MIANIKPEDIDATLKQGQIFAGKIWRNIIVIMYIAIGVMFAILLFVVIDTPLENNVYSHDDVVEICCASGLIAILLGSTLMIQLFCGSGKRKVKKYIPDAVLLKARAVSLGEKLASRGLMVRTAVAIEVSFTYDDKRYVKQSTYKDKPLYLAVYTKYINKTITIAYSPKYDEVMLIKPGSTKENE